MDTTDFLNSILHDFYTLMHHKAEDNFDFRRYSPDGIDRSSEFNTKRHTAYLAYFILHHVEFFATWKMLKDNASRDLFKRLIPYRLLGHQHVQIHPNHNWINERQLISQATQLITRTSDISFTGDQGPLQHFEKVAIETSQVHFDGWVGCIVHAFLKKQYFFERGNIAIKPVQGDYVIDAGACFGDTALAFSCAVGQQGRVWAFDPLPPHLTVIQHNILQNNFTNIEAVPLAVGEESNHLSSAAPIGPNTMQPGFCIFGNDTAIPITTIDDFVHDKSIPKIDFIKMDIEGAELAAIKGAKKTIEKFRPKLAISLYHKRTDFVDIPHFIAQQFPFYDFHLDHYTIHSEETVLFCKPRDSAP